MVTLNQSGEYPGEAIPIYIFALLIPSHVEKRVQCQGFSTFAYGSSPYLHITVDNVSIKQPKNCYFRLGIRSAMEKFLFPVIGIVILVLYVNQQVKGNAGKKLIFQILLAALKVTTVDPILERSCVP